MNYTVVEIRDSLTGEVLQSFPYTYDCAGEDTDIGLCGECPGCLMSDYSAEGYIVTLTRA